MIFTWKTDSDFAYFKRKRSKDRCTSASTSKRPQQQPANAGRMVGRRMLSRSLTTRDDLCSGRLTRGVLLNRDLLRREHSWSPSGKRGWSARRGE
uniref:Uncharacterized protein n=1 Tax=Plectus sambesii TaxID=2011161 RepID=A0A914UMN2_9BILA